MEQLQEMYDSGDYRTCLQQVATVMRLTGPAAKSYDKDQLQLLRGETLMSLNDPRTANAVSSGGIEIGSTRCRASLGAHW